MAASNASGVWQNGDRVRRRLTSTMPAFRPLSTKIHSCVTQPCFSGSHVYHICCCQILQKYNIVLLIVDSGAAPWLTFLESSRGVDVKQLQFTCNAATYRFPGIRGQVTIFFILRGQKWSTQNPFLTQHSETPKDIATKRREVKTRLERSYRANNQADRPHRRRYICAHTITELKQMKYPTKRILALRLSNNNKRSK